MKISALFVYPVKSCQGVPLEQVSVGHTGLQHDRRFMLVRPDGAVLTQRDEPFMTRIEARVTEGDVLELRSEGAAPLRITTRAEGAPSAVEVWGTRCEVIDQGEAVAAWLSACLGTPARLVAMSAGFERPAYSGFPRALDGRVLFADAAPILVIGEASLLDLNRRLKAPLPMDRFRPNLVVTGSAPYAEDDWERVRIGGLELTRVNPCGRCAITTTDQLTGERGKEPLATLATYRQHPELGVVFGTYFANAEPGRLKVGDEVAPE